MSASAGASAGATKQIHLGFDMGIRNLAYCLMEHFPATAAAGAGAGAPNTFRVLAWDNIDLLEGGTSAQDAKRCTGCKGVAKWLHHADGTKWCGACATQTRVKKAATAKPTLPALPCTIAVKALRSLEDAPKKGKKEELIVWAQGRYLMPWKPSHAMDASLQTIRVAIDRWLDSVLPTFASASLIRLENQPVMKGPTMKSVQMILFTLLGHRLEREHGWSGTIEFVHAGTKSKGHAAAPTAISATTATTATTATAVAGAGSEATVATTAIDSAAYRDRKKNAENDVRDILKAAANASATDWLRFFEGRSKKSDLADAFLMAHRPSGGK
jgi:hypothetical protein